MHMGFDWDTNDVSIKLLAKLAKPLLGTARIVVNSLHMKGDVSTIAIFYLSLNCLGENIAANKISSSEVNVCLPWISESI